MATIEKDRQDDMAEVRAARDYHEAQYHKWDALADEWSAELKGTCGPRHQHCLEKRFECEDKARRHLRQWAADGDKTGRSVVTYRLLSSQPLPLLLVPQHYSGLTNLRRPVYR